MACVDLKPSIKSHFCIYLIPLALSYYCDTYIKKYIFKRRKPNSLLVCVESVSEMVALVNELFLQTTLQNFSLYYNIFSLKTLCGLMGILLWYMFDVQSTPLFFLLGREILSIPNQLKNYYPCIKRNVNVYLLDD